MIFEYVGTKIDEHGRIQTEINNRIPNTSRLYHSLNNGVISKKETSIKTKNIQDNIYPNLTFLPQTCTLRKRQTKSPFRPLKRNTCGRYKE